MTAEKNISHSSISLDAISHFYFIGIGGIGMSALARYFKQQGNTVCGYDKTQTELTSALKNEQIDIHFEDSLNHIPTEFKQPDSKHILVIYTPALSSNHSQLSYFKENNFTVIKRSEALGLITNQSNGLAVAGTHGKTTTSSILAHILHASDYPVSAFLGGIAINFNSNFIHTNGASTTVVEADEFDRSFLTLTPYGAIITSTDADHLDIYGEEHALIESFKQFSSLVKGPLVVHENSADKFINHSNLKTYGVNDSCHYQLISRKTIDGEYVFSIKTTAKTYKNIKFSMPGLHNSLNATAAVALGIENGFDGDKLTKALSNFKGIKRRFQFILNSTNHTFIDDYAHHPAELNASISASRELFPYKKLTGIFQPHLFSRTRDFMHEFAESLSQLDELILLDIYPAREEPILGITSQALLKLVRTKCELLTKNEVLEWVKTNKPELLMTLGAGDIDKLVEPLKEILS